MEPKEYERNSKLHMIFVSYNNDRHPVPKTFTPLHYTLFHFTTLHYTTLHDCTTIGGKTSHAIFSSQCKNLTFT